MRNFPTINDKFYRVGQGLPSMRAAVEMIGQMESDYEKTPPPTPDLHGEYRDRVESNSFSIIIGALDGLLKRK